MYIGLYILAFVIVLGAQLLVTTTYNRYKVVKNKKGLTGFDVARRILDQNNLSNIHVVETKGLMSDHYDPRRKVVRLSSEVFHNDSITALAIAAHECGHAIQDKENYVFMRLRSLIAPFIGFVSKIGYIVLLVGLIASLLNLAYIGVWLLATTLIFQLVTLPVELDASNRAKLILVAENFVIDNEIDKVKSMLMAAAFTYIASLISNLLEILRLFLIFSDRN